ncbi:hypothetical protein GCM10010493_59020 [Streptomyces lavendulae subsp. grasserius]
MVEGAVLQHEDDGVVDPVQETGGPPPVGARLPAPYRRPAGGSAAATSRASASRNRAARSPASSAPAAASVRSSFKATPACHHPTLPGRLASKGPLLRNRLYQTMPYDTAGNVPSSLGRPRGLRQRIPLPARVGLSAHMGPNDQTSGSL